MTDLEFAWLEITGKCQLTCTHCYAESGPEGTDGAMLPSDWLRVIDEVADLGGRSVQFIGGEPTLHQDLPTFVEHALDRRLGVEVFSNLVHVSPELWETFARPGVRLATSYYSDSPAEHETITRGRGSHARTKANIATAVRRSIPLRVGLIDIQDGQRVRAAHAELRSLGVQHIGADRLRHVGRGAPTRLPGPDQLCGRCGHSAFAVAASGDVWPCVFSRWMKVGNVRESPLAEILGTRQMAMVAGPPSCWPQGGGPCNPNDRLG